MLENISAFFQEFISVFWDEIALSDTSDTKTYFQRTSSMRSISTFLIAFSCYISQILSSSSLWFHLQPHTRLLPLQFPVLDYTYIFLSIYTHFTVSQHFWFSVHRALRTKLTNRKLLFCFICFLFSLSRENSSLLKCLVALSSHFS